MGEPARALSTRIVHGVVIHGQSLDGALAQHLATAARADQPFIQAQCYGTLRKYEPLAAVVDRLLSKPLKRRDQDIYCLLLIGLYELWHMHTPAHACLSETVQASVALDKGWAKGLVNAVLRRAQRERAQLEQAAQHHEEARYCLPAWLLQRIRTDWPQHWQQIALSLREPAPMTLRVNRRRMERADYIKQLEHKEITARAHPWVESAVELDEARDVAELPGFTEGWFSVQDAAAQLAAPLLDPRPGDRILDACAAPGGKTAHLAEYQPQHAELWAVDVDPKRLQRVNDNLQRLGLSAEVIDGDAARPSSWWDGRPFDRILLDAPCSATGVIRRHPDIKRLRRATDLEPLAQHQQQLLDALWPLLAPGGMLLYATCSIVKTENNDRIAEFVTAHAEARHRPVSLPAGRACDFGHQLLPGEDGMDGFFYAALLKEDS